VCAVVGVHLLPLAPLLPDRRLVLLGVLVTLVALVALVAGLAEAATPSWPAPCDSQADRRPGRRGAGVLTPVASR
jgi:hypothetical protein